MPELGMSGSVGATGGKLPVATRPKLPESPLDSAGSGGHGQAQRVPSNVWMYPSLQPIRNLSPSWSKITQRYSFPKASTFGVIPEFRLDSSIRSRQA